MLNAFIRRRHVRAVVAALSFMALAGADACYAYQPATATTAAMAPKAGERVRIVLTPQGITDMARYLGPNVAVAEGVLDSLTGSDAIVVAVDFIQTTNGIRQPWSGEGVVTFPHGYVNETQHQTFQKGRSIAAFTALGVVLVAIAVLALRSGGAKGGGDAGGQPPP